MATITVTIPDALAVELDQIAIGAGYANVKLMFVAYLKAQIRGSRGNKAVVGLRETAEKAADEATEAIK